MYVRQIRAVAQETTYVESTFQVWSRAVQARRVALAAAHAKIAEHRVEVEKTARNKTLQVSFKYAMKAKLKHRLTNYFNVHEMLRVDLLKMTC